MALSKSITLPSGLTANNAYIRIESVSIIKNEITGVTVNFFVSSSNVESPIAVHCYGFDYTFDGSNPIQQAYEYLKTLPEFADATDC
jgi:hypothetical protein